MPFFIAALGIGAVGTVASVVQTRKAAKQGRRAEETQQRQADVKAARERVRIAREARIQRAAVAQAAETSGAEGSSAIGAGQSIAAQEASNISFLDQVQQLSQEASIFRQGAASARGRAGTASGVASLGLTVATNKAQIESIFK